MEFRAHALQERGACAPTESRVTSWARIETFLLARTGAQGVLARLSTRFSMGSNEKKMAP